jgi:CO/xanthine dehydrogenase Mo-binding subunit
MTPNYFGKKIFRLEDHRLLTGQALFVDDVNLPGMLHAAFYRSDYAHAIIQNIDVSGAINHPGVLAIYTANDLLEYWKPGPLLVSPPPIKDIIFNERTQVPLAKNKVRHAGEAIAVVVAESRYIAEDAFDKIIVDLDPLEAVVDMEAALEPASVKVHDDLNSNLAAHVVQEKGSYNAIKNKADLIIQKRFLYDRGASAAIENRGIVASWDEKTQQLTVWDTTQAPIPIRNGLAQMLGLSEYQVQVIAPFIGGGFGPKIMMFYPEEVLVPWLSMKLKRPVKWIEDRQENFFATTQERGQIHDSEMAVSKDGEILGVRDVFLHDTGAYDPYGLRI